MALQCYRSERTPVYQWAIETRHELQKVAICLGRGHICLGLIHDEMPQPGTRKTMKIEYLQKIVSYNVRPPVISWFRFALVTIVICVS